MERPVVAELADVIGSVVPEAPQVTDSANKLSLVPAAVISSTQRTSNVAIICRAVDNFVCLGALCLSKQHIIDDCS